MEMILADKRIKATERVAISVYNPANKKSIGKVPVATKEDIDYVLEKAQAAQKKWERVSIYQRTLMTLAFAEEVEKNINFLAELLSSENGKTVFEARAEIKNAIETFRGFVEKARHTYNTSFPAGMEAGTESRMQLVERDPVGVVACIIPFNFPINLFSHKAAPALITGNTLIVKPPTECPLTLIEICKLFGKVGFEDGVVNVVTGKGSEIGPWLVDNTIVGAISFTGSTDVGSCIAALAGKNIIPVTLELGGNDPLIILADADLDLAVAESVECRVTNTGQICNASKRFIVHQSIKDKFINLLKQALEKCQVGDPQDPSTKVGCLISEEAAIEVEAQVKKCVEEGAKIVFGGERKGAYYYPTILDQITTDMDIAKDLEIFGPIFPIVVFDEIQEAIDIANASKYGLSSGVISKDIGMCLRVAKKLKTGNVVINGGGRLRSREMPYGGHKKSGIGSEGISVTLNEYTRPKNIMIKGVFDD